jgi:cytochrome c peroxidase
MKNLSRLSAMAITSALALTSAWAGGCAPKCRSKCSPAATRCGPKCGTKCGAKCGAAADPKLIKRPAGYRPNYPSTPEALAAGGKLFRDTTLSTNGMSCASCHEGGKSYQPSFAQPFPHKMAMAATSYGVKQLHLDEAIQVCMIGPMAAKPLPWKSAELANLVAFMKMEHKKFGK